MEVAHIERVIAPVFLYLCLYFDRRSGTTAKAWPRMLDTRSNAAGRLTERKQQNKKLSFPSSIHPRSLTHLQLSSKALLFPFSSVVSSNRKGKRRSPLQPRH